MKILSKIIIAYCILVGIIGNVLEVFYLPEVYFIRKFTIVLSSLWVIIGLINLLIEIKKAKGEANYQYQLKYFIIGICMTMVLVGSFGIGMFFIYIYPGSWIRIISLVLTVPPLIYFFKEY